MKKLDKVVDKSPIIYALLLPIVFYLQVGGATILNIHPVIIDLMDLLRIVVIVMFSCYVLKTFKIFENEKDPSMMFMIMAGISFLELVFNIIVSLELSSVTRDVANVVFIASIVLQMALEVVAFAIMARYYEALTVVIWAGIHIALFILFLAICNDYNKTLLIWMGCVAVARDIYKGRIIYMHAKRHVKEKAAS